MLECEAYSGVVTVFHPGKITKVLNNSKDEISADGVAQAMVMMWDENLVTLLVSPKLQSKIKEGDIVIVDYRPMEKLGVPVPKQTITKILRGKKAQEVWTEYTEYHEKRKRSANRLPTAQPGGYIG